MIKNPISYPGNKNKLLNQIIPLFPDNVTKVVDVFCGSGVVGLNTQYANVVLNDICKEITDVISYFYNTSFATIVSDIESIIYQYGLTYSRKKEKGYYVEKKHEGLSLYNKEAYSKLKAQYNLEHKVQQLVVLLIYGFNHYLRFNKKGEFNVPVGKVDFSNSIYNDLEKFVNGIKNKNIQIMNLDFRSRELFNDCNAIYYFDPPYLITSAPYNLSWSEKDEKDLLSLLDELNNSGKKFMLSNVILSNGKENLFLKEWSKKYIVTIMKRQYRNANYQKRNITDSIEVIIKNF